MTHTIHATRSHTEMIGRYEVHVIDEEYTREASVPEAGAFLAQREAEGYTVLGWQGDFILTNPATDWTYVIKDIYEPRDW